MRLLAIDTSGRALSAALAEDGEVIASFGVDEGKNHSLTLLPNLQRLLQEQQLTLDQMDAFAGDHWAGEFHMRPPYRVGALPLRLGDKLWKNPWWLSPLLMLLRLLPLLAVMQHRCSTHGVMRSIQRFTVMGRDWGLTALWLRQQLAEELTQLSAPVTFSGDGVDPYRTLFAEALGAGFQLPADGNTLFFAAAAARLACAKYAAGEISDVAALVPVISALIRGRRKKIGGP